MGTLKRNFKRFGVVCCAVAAMSFSLVLIVKLFRVKNVNIPMQFVFLGAIVFGIVGGFFYNWDR